MGYLKQPRTSLTNSVSTLFSLTHSFALPAFARSRIFTARLSLAMNTGTSEFTPEELAQSEKLVQRIRGRKKPKHEAKLNKPTPPPQPENSRFLARPWITFPEVSETLVRHRVRVMTWNVCPNVSPCSKSELNTKSSCWPNASFVRWEISYMWAK